MTPQQSFRTALAGYRVTRDAEGWPMTPGRLGRIEFYDGRDLAVYTDRPRTARRLLALPGVRRHQLGDEEARCLFPPSALPAVAAVVKARRKRSMSPEQARKLGAGTAYRTTSQPQEPTLAPEPTDTTGRPA